MNRLIGSAVVLGLALLTCRDAMAQRSQNPPVPRDLLSTGSEQGWVSLFDGKTLSGWQVKELRGPGTSKWEVVDGAIVGTGQPSMLYSPKGHYKNFRYRAELKINDHGNSGMYIRWPKNSSFSEGYEIQVNSTHRDPIKTGSVYTFAHYYKEAVPPDTFFTQEIEARDGEFRGKPVTSITVSINGEKLLQFLDYAKSWDNPGHFAFQQHDPGSKVTIRKIEVMELPEMPAKTRSKAKAR